MTKNTVNALKIPKITIGWIFILFANKIKIGATALPIE
jgi:hypothetical protein